MSESRAITLDLFQNLLSAFKLICFEMKISSQQILGKMKLGSRTFSIPANNSTTHFLNVSIPQSFIMLKMPSSQFLKMFIFLHLFMFIFVHEAFESIEIFQIGDYYHSFCGFFCQVYSYKVSLFILYNDIISSLIFSLEYYSNIEAYLFNVEKCFTIFCSLLFDKMFVGKYKNVFLLIPI